MTYGLSGDTSRDNNDFRTLKGLLETVILRSEASNLFKESISNLYAMYNDSLRT